MKRFETAPNIPCESCGKAFYLHDDHSTCPQDFLSVHEFAILEDALRAADEGEVDTTTLDDNALHQFIAPIAEDVYLSTIHEAVAEVAKLLRG